MTDNKLEPIAAIEAEQSVLGAILREAATVDEVVSIFKDAETFYVVKHRVVFRAIMELYEHEVPIDITSVAQSLADGGDLEKIGGRSYLIELVSACITAANVSTYASIVKEKYNLRKMVSNWESLIKDAYDLNLDSAELVGRNEEVLMSLTDKQVSEPISIKELVPSFIQGIEEGKFDNHEEQYLTTPIPELNHLVTGIFRGETTVIAGPPSMGKSSLALQVALHNAQQGKTVLYFAMDETKEAIVQRIVSSKTGFGRKQFFPPRFDGNDTLQLRDVAHGIQKQAGNMFVLDMAGLTALDIKAKCRQIKRKYGLDGVIVDYIQQIRPFRKYERRDLELGDASGILKQIAKDLNLAMIVVSQLSREWGKGNFDPKKNQFGFPRASQLRDSGVLEQDANMIWFPWQLLMAMKLHGWSEQDGLYQQELMSSSPESRKAWIVVAKNKLEATGEVECRWNGPKMTYYTVDNYHQEELPSADDLVNRFDSTPPPARETPVEEPIPPPEKEDENDEFELPF